MAVFKERDKLLESYADIVVDCSDLNVYSATAKVQDKIFDYYEV